MLVVKESIEVFFSTPSEYDEGCKKLHSEGWFTEDKVFANGSIVAKFVRYPRKVVGSE